VPWGDAGPLAGIYLVANFPRSIGISVIDHVLHRPRTHKMVGGNQCQAPSVTVFYAISRATVTDVENGSAS
jgi:hypothetical protein